jgi:hypothetical protein
VSRVLTIGLLVVLFAANVSKWQMQVGVGVSYYYAPLLLWCLGMVLFLGRRGMRVPREIKVLAGLKVSLLLAIALSAPWALSDPNPELTAAFARGLAVTFVNVVGIVMVLVFAGAAGQRQRDKLLDGYLGVVAFCGAYTLSQGIAAYGFGVDLDETVSGWLPLIAADAASVGEDSWSELGTVFYRLTGLAGDPNLNATVFLIALPVAFYRLREQRLLSGLVVLLGVAIIAQSLSLTVVPVAIMVLMALYFRFGLRHPLSVLPLVIGMAGAAWLAWVYVAEPFAIMGRGRLQPGGSGSAHLRIMREAMRIWMDHPMGLGLNGFPLYSEQYSTHNSYLQKLVDLGVPGVLAALSVVLYSLRVALKRWRGFGFVAATSVVGLASVGVGHDVLNRFELEAVTLMLVALTITDDREHLETAVASESPRSSPPSRSPTAGSS